MNGTRSLFSSVFSLRPIVNKATVGTMHVPKRVFSSAAEASTEALSTEVTAYNKGLSYMHWFMGVGTLTCFATVQASMATKDNKQKGQYMMIHKSTGVLLMAAITARIALRALAGKGGIPPLPSGSQLEQLTAKASHTALYAMMLGMPATGIAMGYYGGRGLPFYGLFTIPGAPKESRNGQIAKDAFKVHKLMGQAMEYFAVPLHVGAVGFHLLKGQNLLTRMHPFVKSASSVA